MGVCDSFCYICGNFVKMFEDFRLKIFLAVAQEGGFTKAASVLGVTQPSVSQNIAELERQVGTKLFDRQRTEVVLTPAGRLFKEYVMRIQKTSSQASQILKRFPDMTVRIDASEDVFDYILSELIPDFIEAHPEVVFERAFLGDNDLVVRIAPIHRKRGMLTLSYHPSPEFAATRLWRVLSECLKPAFE